MPLATAHIRIARPTDDIDKLLPFYRDGLGFEILGSFDDHQGFDGVMLGHKSAGYHLEFTRSRGHVVGRAPTQDNLLIFYLPETDSYARAVARMKESGFPAVASFNPYWDKCGKTFEDPDGYRVTQDLLRISPRLLPSHLCLKSPFHIADKFRLWWLCLTAVIAIVSGQQTGEHPDWPRWCGKVYQPGYPNFDPGGQTFPPLTPLITDQPLLHVLFRPRYSLYLDNEEYGEFVVNAEFSLYHGTPWPNTTSSSKWANRLIFSINVAEDDEPLVQNTVPVNTTGNIFRFELARLKPSFTPIEIVLYGAPEDGTPAWTATTTLLYLPSKPNGSVTRIDNLRGGLYFSNPSTNHTFTPFFPYGFYASYDGFLRHNDTSLIDQYTALGLNAMTPLTSFNDSDPILDYMSQTNLPYMYSLRDIYRNTTLIPPNLRARTSPATTGLFAYWTADEPDGWQDPFALPEAAQTLIHALDPYHPVAVTLNCADYYFGPYSASADLLMADVYPIGINATYSKWGTPCNATYGDCGCDNCEGVVQDVPRRLEKWKRLGVWLGRWPKTVLVNPQAFHGENYWLRDPGVEESWVMVLLAVNHGVKGVISWVWPTSEVLAVAHGELARVLARGEVLGFVVGGEGPGILGVEPEGTEVVDVAGWVVDGKMLVSVVNGGYVDVEEVAVLVPNATVIESTPWGTVKWKLEGGKLSVPLLPALATSLVILDLRGDVV
ncbi:hypothetical protein CHGG_02474 [Chaetomium globosum CBS 148.51]|uniref:VOC domain-containing protein n=1 Tax=Chaetomium globosum (strain ATCC 6205 / CBS 148.51 / DSM 1962 / NBRC 6347 / NRRL 1970) TaxID=306901 RepID=Q2HBD0_CHAGB|nr:uncharacterized protein CHGG_02474 [Chaetomium globosum CBS 148.51]EAQ90539.1 hypothetical protein CHGG_02474 [Chaetomium globosum CBS 148.51]